MNHRDLLEEGSVIDEVAGREVVGPIHDHVIAVDDVKNIVRPKARVVGHHVQIRVHRSQCLFGRVDFALANAVQVMKDLALQIRSVDHVHVDNPEGSHPCGGQIER